SLLVSSNCKLVDYTTDSMGQMWFQFEDTNAARELERNFHLSTATTNVQQFVGAQKMLKALIYDNRRNIYEHRIGKQGVGR
ncbi:MAG: hypothetical protein ABIG42_05575, partial [bacterium]